MGGKEIERAGRPWVGTDPPVQEDIYKNRHRVH
jgi:hypothetical protein